MTGPDIKSTITATNLSTIASLLIAVGSLAALYTERSRTRKGKSRARDDDNDDDDDSQARSPHSTTTIPRPGIVHGVAGLIGHTPLMRIESLSDLTGCEILGKAEFLNPAGSPKDRVALQILLDAEAAGLISPHTGDCVFEGTVGSTGISLATLCRAKGYRCSIVLPDDVAVEKSELLEKLGAEVKKVRPRGIVDPRHFVNEARALAKAFGEGKQGEVDVVQVDEQATTSVAIPKKEGQEESGRHRRPRGFFADQFETPSNFLAHYTGTGPEIWAQCGGTEHTAPRLDAFVAGAGTGGTLSGVAACLREREQKQAEQQRQKKPSTTSRSSSFFSSWFSSPAPASPPQPSPSPSPHPIRMVLADPQGSGLYNKIHHGVMYSHTEREGTRRRHQVDTVIEGIGMNRITQNLSFGVDLIDDAISVQDEQAVRMSRWLSVRDGLFVGSSSAVNVIAAVKTAVRIRRQWEQDGKEGRPTVVTILCDSGGRHLSKFHNDKVLRNDFGINVSADPMQVDITDLLQG